MSLTVVFKGLFHRVCFCHQLLLLFFGRPALRLFLRTPVLFFLFSFFCFFFIKICRTIVSGMLWEYLTYLHHFDDCCGVNG